MSKRIFSEEQIKTLLQNPNVSGCSSKSISYNKDFKIAAVEKYREGLQPSEIFKEARFDINMIGCDSPHECLRRWLKKGEAGLKSDDRKTNNPKGRPKTNWLNEKEKIRYLEAENAYLKAENSFLAKLRKKS